MKRDKNLETLSWEHHNGLVAAFRLERGLTKDADLQIMREYILEVWNSELKHHFWQEEETLPDSIKSDSAGEMLLERMLGEHKQFGQLIDKIKNENADLSENLKAFAGLLDRHIRFEERELFEWLQKHVPTKKMQAIGVFLHEQHRPMEKDFQPEFWK